MIELNNYRQTYIQHQKERIKDIKFRRVGTNDDSQYFEGYINERKDSKGNVYRYFIVIKCYSVNMYKTKYIEVDNVFKGVEFQEHEIEVL